MSDDPNFTDEQKSYLGGFVRGVDAARTRSGLPSVANELGDIVGLPPAATTAPSRPELVHLRAQDRFLAEGKKLCPEEEAKRAENPLDVWDRMQQVAREGRFPKGIDVFRWKFHGLFNVAPAEEAFMCRLRLPGGGNGSGFRSMAAVRDHSAAAVAGKNTAVLANALDVEAWRFRTTENVEAQATEPRTSRTPSACPAETAIRSQNMTAIPASPTRAPPTALARRRSVPVTPAIVAVMSGIVP